MTAREEWRPVPGYPGYEVSDLGRVRSLPRVIGRRDGSSMRIRGRILRRSLHRGYPLVNLALTGLQPKAHAVHRLVLLAFVGPLPEGLCTRHMNGVKTDCRLVNLRYGTHAENIADRRRLMETPHGEHHWKARLSTDDVLLLRALKGKRHVDVAADLFGVSRWTVYDVWNGRGWAHV